MSEQDEYTDDEIRETEIEVERFMTVREIFDEGYRAGHAMAGLQSRPEQPYRAWLASRLESRWGRQ